MRPQSTANPPSPYLVPTSGGEGQVEGGAPAISINGRDELRPAIIYASQAEFEAAQATKNVSPSKSNTTFNGYLVVIQAAASVRTLWSSEVDDANVLMMDEDLDEFNEVTPFSSQSVSSEQPFGESIGRPLPGNVQDAPGQQLATSSDNDLLAEIFSGREFLSEILQ